MVSKHLKHINNLKNLKVENVKALLKDSFIREGAFLEMKENCNPANGEAIDKALVAHSRKPAVTSATNIKEKNDYLFYLYAAFAFGGHGECGEKLKDYISKLCFHKLKPHFHSKVYKTNADFIRNDDNLSGLSDFLIAFSDEALPKDITLAVKGEFIPSRQAVYIPFCIAGLFADAIKTRPADENEINDQFYEFIEYKFSDVDDVFCCENFDDDSNDHILKFESHRHLTPNFFSRLYPNFAYKKESSVILGMPGAVAFRIGKSYLNGDFLPMDKQKAKEWFSYGMVVGDPYCALAYLMYFVDLSLDDELRREPKLATIYSILLNTFLIAYNEKRLPMANFVSFDSITNSCKTIQEISFYNLLSFVNNLRYEVLVEDLPFALPSVVMKNFSDILMEFADEYAYNPRTLAAIAVYLSAQANLDNSTKYLNGLLKIAKIKKRCKEPSDKLFALLDYGLAREDEDTYQAYENLYCLYKGPFEKIDKDILEKMSEQGNGKATFTLGNLSLTSASDKKSLVIWKKAAEQGNGFSKLNLAMGHLIKKEIPKAIYYATQAIRHGIVFGYYILYKAYLEDNPALAFTYLRYAKEYLIPDAVSEYKAAVNSGVYEPLPYMKRIEELEKMAENNAPACLVMSEIYNSAILLPYNIERTFHYQQLAISNGCVSFFSFYKEIYGHAFPPDMEKSSVFSSFRKSLEKMQSFFSGAATDDSAEHEAVVNKVEEIYEALVKGTTVLENDVLYELSESKFYNHFGHKVKLPKSLRKPIECSVDELKEKLQDGTYNTLLGSDFYQHPGQNVIAYCLEEPYSKLPNSQNLLITRALMSVRALTFAPEYSTYKEFMKLAKNSGNTTAMILGDLDFSAVCDSKEGALDINKCEKTGEESAELSDPDVFISTVAQ